MACIANDNCNGLAGTPYCSGGACVACTDAAQCSGNAPVCDATSHSCRGCSTDGECQSTVCLAATGVCADAADVIFVSSTGTDAGGCDASAPCATLGYAFSQVMPQRSIIHILGDSYSVGSGAVELDVTVYIDGSTTHVTRASTGPVFTLSTGSTGTVTLGDMIIGNTGTNMQSVSVSGPNLGVISLYGVSLLAPFAINAGALSIDESNITAGAVSTCAMSSGTLDLRRSQLTSGLDTSSCGVTMVGNTFRPAMSPAVHITGGLARIENNVFASSDSTATGISINAQTGSTVRFNTFFNSSGVDQMGRAVDCNATSTTTVTSNIFAWHSSNPARCSTQFSLFDEVSGTQPGTSNMSGNVASFFNDPAHGDLHLAPSSPAIGHGEPGLLSTDLEGHPRPAPQGTDPDVGAYEAP